MHEQVTAASSAYLDLTWKIGTLYWASSQCLAKSQAEAGVRIFTESANRLKDTLGKRNGDRPLTEWNSLYLDNADKVFDVARIYLEEAGKIGVEAAQVLDEYASLVAKQAKEIAENQSTLNDAVEKGVGKTRKAA